MGGEYTGYHHDVKKTLIAVRPHVTDEDYDHIERILLDGCPAELKFTEPLSNKLEMIWRGNVIGHGILAGTYLAEYRDSLK